MAVAPWIAVVLLLSVVVGSRGFYLPGVAPADFQKVRSFCPLLDLFPELTFDRVGGLIPPDAEQVLISLA
ncbi:hypothetical protein C4D60_Mb10t22240 [Musa balbisiana]|uniref:Uncharacterized protein n=1 Tax=Musa balbisiana TaxID=52838 RepID=A0A4S8IZ14_MUSBA|nr:hypothetical protein C4D60_Mb10t22240 [Musa balbisiana]